MTKPELRLANKHQNELTKIQAIQASYHKNMILGKTWN